MQVVNANYFQILKDNCFEEGQVQNYFVAILHVGVPTLAIETQLCLVNFVQNLECE